MKSQREQLIKRYNRRIEKYNKLLTEHELLKTELYELQNKQSECSVTKNRAIYALQVISEIAQNFDNEEINS